MLWYVAVNSYRSWGFTLEHNSQQSQAWLLYVMATHVHDYHTGMYKQSELALVHRLARVCGIKSATQVVHSQRDSALPVGCSFRAKTTYAFTKLCT